MIINNIKYKPIIAKKTFMIKNDQWQVKFYLAINNKLNNHKAINKPKDHSHKLLIAYRICKGLKPIQPTN